ncbi:MAG: phosphate regulon sensor histidine kinase PhoR [Woeseiaceae bacterium]
MPESWRRFLTGTVLLLAGGTLIGWIYGHPDWGLLIAALVGLAWHVRQLLVFERALRTGDFEPLRYGEGIWSKIFARFSYLKQQGRKHKQRYRRLLKEVRNSANALPDGGIVLNADYEILLCNAAAQDLVGFRPRQDRGQRVDNILRDPRFIQYLKSQKFETGVEIMSPVQESHWLFCRLVPYGADQKLLIVRDITERRRLASMRREFVANASHELRSPLTVISGYLDTLSDDPEVPAGWRAPLAQMRLQAARMNNIVAELLELSRLESATGASANQQVDMHGLLVSARKAYAGREDVANIRVDCESRAQILGSIAEIESVIGNLLSNAVRHTPRDGEVILRWSTGPDGGHLAVIDNGEGIAEDHIPRLTERFFRVDPGRSRDDGGVGLGLAIVKHALGRHDAELEIKSRLGEGSSFVCHFPPERIVTPAPASIAGNSRRP